MNVDIRTPQKVLRLKFLRYIHSHSKSQDTKILPLRFSTLKQEELNFGANDYFWTMLDCLAALWVTNPLFQQGNRSVVNVVPLNCRLQHWSYM